MRMKQEELGLTEYLVETDGGVDPLFACLVPQAVTVAGEGGLRASAAALTRRGAQRQTRSSLEATHRV